MGTNLNSKQNLKQFVVHHVDYYQKVFSDFEKKDTKFTFNFAALIGGSLWFFIGKFI